MKNSFIHKLNKQLQSFLAPTKNFHPNKVYWVIEESETPKKTSIVKYYNDKNELLHEEEITNTKRGVIDEHLMSRLQTTLLRIQKYGNLA